MAGSTAMRSSGCRFQNRRRERTVSKELSHEDRSAAIEILTAWNGCRVAMVWAVDRFPSHARATLDVARRVLKEAGEHE
ncbi:hypothetical protein AA0498_1827 [Acidomonas methanolica]|nr:hypothetical protein AA0498_1827 [Acidomonas methanolica]